MVASFRGLVKFGLGLFGLGPLRRYPFVRRQAKYRIPKGPFSVLDTEYFERRELTSPRECKTDHNQEELEANPVYQIWKGIPGGNKWIHYFRVYERISKHFDGNAINMLEIGVDKGRSLEMWRKLLSEDSVIVGIDIDQACGRFEDRSRNLHVRIGDQSEGEFLSKLVKEFGPFDFVLDDGSHLCSDMIKSFNHLFLHGLKDDGIYLVEDVHANFWPFLRDKKYSFLDLSKDLVDFIHAHYWRQPGPDFQFGYSDRPIKKIVPRIASEIREISFEDSLITIYKKKRTTTSITVRVEDAFQ